MTPEDAATRSALPQERDGGSGDLQLELTITKLRGSMLRLVTEMDRFTASVKQARGAVDHLHDSTDAQPDDRQADKWND